ncbi:MAG: 5-methyltetrahydropteroyltriglutamate--homocysteine methyltransferase [Betaproteobacteria bacterium]|jgi:5-methyltetrahydropteroyltriglutamate--homocysteine methyltransferase|nr:5-methyltetrahydropteroyltriglutamate--homocysteine methyltransferase [Betaproteobacteria bacterium]
MSLDFLRADVVGSLLRPAAWREARAAFDDGRMTEKEFRRIEDEAVRDAIRFQESLGLEVVTDGEIRRLNFQDSFGAAVSGFAASATTLRATEARVAGGSAMARFDMPDLHQHGPAVTRRRPAVRRLKLERNVLLEEYRFARGAAKKPVKVTLIGPDRIGQRFAHEESRPVYADADAFLADVVAIERQMIAAVAADGCRYVQIDAPGYTAYVDGPSLEAMRSRGEDPMRNFERSLAADAEVMRGFDGVTFGIHLCRGNQHSMWHREGHYDAIAERLFNALPHQRFLLEYDSPRAGSFEPLRHVPKGKVCVLGLVSTKVAELETPDALARRIDEAARYLPLEQLALSPQCGFASDVAGNRITEDDQRRKLEVVVETARLVWG